MKKSIQILSLILVLTLTSISVNGQDQKNYEYAYISVQGKVLSKKLRVTVDFGDTEEQITRGEQFSEQLNNKKSFASILNYMVDNNFELVETLDYSLLSQGTGGTTGIVFIMRKEK